MTWDPDCRTCNYLGTPCADHGARATVEPINSPNVNRRDRARHNQAGAARRVRSK